MSNRDTDEQACLAFKKFCQPWGFARKQDPDIHIDYVVELRDGDRPTGQNIAVQVKGTSAPKVVDGRVSKRMKVQHLKYYLNDLTMPVFIVVVDVKADAIYWVFAQEWLREVDIKWQDQKSLTVYASKPIGSEKGPPAEVEEALKYMRRMHPGTVPDAAAKLKESLEAKDPRFVARPEYKGGETRVTLVPKSTVSGTLHLDGADTREKMRRAIESGAPVGFSPGELAFNGSELLNELFSGQQGAFELRTQKTLDCECALIDPLDDSVIVRHRPARIEAGTSTGVLMLEYGGGLLCLSAELDMRASGESRMGEFRLKFSYDRWIGKNVQSLPDFERINRLAKHVVDGRRMAIDCEVSERTMFRAELSAESAQPHFSRIAGLFNLLDCLQKTADYCAALIRVPSIEGLLEEEELLLQLPEIIAKGRVDFATGIHGDLEIEVHSASDFLAKNKGQLEVVAVKPLFESFTGSHLEWGIRDEYRGLAVAGEESKRLEALGDVPAKVRISATDRTSMCRTLVRVNSSKE